jgi:hypothetical protein
MQKSSIVITKCPIRLKTFKYLIVGIGSSGMLSLVNIDSSNLMANCNCKNVIEIEQYIEKYLKHEIVWVR